MLSANQVRSQDFVMGVWSQSPQLPEAKPPTARGKGVWVRSLYY